jgi:hypothetical protein
LAAEFEHDGVPAEKARRSLVEDSRSLRGHLFLRVHAFKPTGVALGYPLPTLGLQSLFSEVCDHAEEFLRHLCGVKGSMLSRVPPTAYHITLVNRTHFEALPDKRNVHPINSIEKGQIERIIRAQDCGAVVVRYRGLLMTSSGRLMVPAYPEDTCLLCLKEALRAGVFGGRSRQPVLGQNYPGHTLTKLGHLVVGLHGLHLRDFIGWMHEEGGKIDVYAKFTDVYTQLGRIAL